MAKHVQDVDRPRKFSFSRDDLLWISAVWDDEHHKNNRDRVVAIRARFPYFTQMDYYRNDEAIMNLEQIIKDRADWLVDAVALVTQNRMFLRGDPEEDQVATEAIEINAKKAIRIAIEKALAMQEARDNVG